MRRRAMRVISMRGKVVVMLHDGWWRLSAHSGLEADPVSRSLRATHRHTHTGTHDGETQTQGRTNGVYAGPHGGHIHCRGQTETGE